MAILGFVLGLSCLAIESAYFVVFVDPQRVSISGLVVPFAILGIVFGITGAWDINHSNGRMRGWGLAATGSLAGLAALWGALIHCSEGHISTTSMRWASASNLRQMAIAIRNYSNEQEYLLPSALRDEHGQPLLSWRVLILPHMELEKLYKEFKLDESWDSPHNSKSSGLGNALYRSHSPDETAPKMFTHFQVFVGGGAAFESDRPVKLDEIERGDGFANTFLIVEAGDPVPWAKPQDLDYRPDKPLPPLGRLWTTHSPYRFGKRHPGFNAVFADHSVRFFRTDTDERVLRALITRNGGERIDWTEIEP